MTHWLLLLMFLHFVIIFSAQVVQGDRFGRSWLPKSQGYPPGFDDQVHASPQQPVCTQKGDKIHELDKAEVPPHRNEQLL